MLFRSRPGVKMRITGEYINYSLSVLDNAPQRDEAIDFVSFMLSDEGLEIFRQNGQDPIIPFSTEQIEDLPSKLLQYLNDYRVNR